MSKRKKIFPFSVLSLVALFLIFVGYHYIRYHQATSRMKELSVDLDKRISEWEKKEYPRSPLFGQSTPGNAAEYYKKALSGYKEDTPNRSAKRELGDQIYNAYEKPEQPISPELKGALQQYQPIFEIIQQGANAETYKSLLNLHGDGWKEAMTGLGRVRETVRLAAIQTRELVKESKVTEAFKLSCATNRLGDDTIRQGTLIGGLVGIALSAVAQNELQRLLNNTEFSEPQLKEIFSYLQVLINSEPSFAYFIETEELYTGAILRQEGNRLGLMPNEELGIGYINRAGLVDAWQKYIPLIREQIQITSLPYAQMDPELSRFDKKIESLDSVTQMILPAISNLHKKYYMLKAQRRGLYLLTALKLYKARRQQYPAKLADLSPEIIKEVSLDPFTDQPFIYKVQPDGSILLYSVGTNLKDDNGDDKNDNDIVITPFRRWQERK